MLSTIFLLMTIIPPEPRVPPIEKEFPAKTPPQQERGWDAVRKGSEPPIKARVPIGMYW